ncbi:MAG: NAD-dependent succinate-semialdehyde dehydrogenase [Alphaproteobacteria bacterium]
MAIQSINPATEEVLKEFQPLSEAELDEALERSASAFERHRHSSFAERAEKMHRAADILERGKKDWGRLMTEEMGKTHKAAVAEAEKCAWVCRFYADNAERFLKDEHIRTEASHSFVRHLPLGPVLAVMPWNFPFWQVFRFAAPALMAGNTGLLKHASNVPRCALAIEEVLREAGFAEGVFQSLLVGVPAVEKILKDRRVRAATLTGSEPAGASVASTAGAQIKKTVLELGGSDPFIVMPSADYDKALDTAVTARNINNGQSCIAAKRFIVHKDIYDRFETDFTERMAALNVGDPMSDGTDIGPLAMAQIRDDVTAQVEDSVHAGAKLLTGGKPRDGKGYFFEPGVLAEIPEDAPAFREEVFGPVALLFRAESFDHAIELANASRFGLGSAIWTTNPKEMSESADRIEAGCTFINAMVASDPRLPFGGVKASGYGRELSELGIKEFVNQKTVSVSV